VCEDECGAARLDVATIDDMIGLELAQKATLPADFAKLHVRLCVVPEEEVLVLGVRLNPGSKLGVLHELKVGLGLIVLRLVLEEKLLVVGVVEDVGVLAPAGVGALLVLSAEPDGELTHQSDELLRRQVALGKALHDKAATVGLSCVLDGISFRFNIPTAHVEDHGGAAAVLNRSVATKLDQVSITHHSGDVVA